MTKREKQIKAIANKAKKYVNKVPAKNKIRDIEKSIRMSEWLAK